MPTAVLVATSDMQGLEAAVARGAVQVKEWKGMQLYYFPSVTVGKESGVSETQTMGRDKETSEEAFGEVCEFFRSLNWDGPTEGAPSSEDACGACMSRMAPGTSWVVFVS